MLTAPWGFEAMEEVLASAGVGLVNHVLHGMWKKGDRHDALRGLFWGEMLGLGSVMKG